MAQGQQMSNAVLGDRIGSLEQDVASLRTSQEQLMASVTHIAQAVDSLRSEVSNSGRPQWGVLASWAGVVIATIAAIGSLVAWGLNSRIDSIDQRIERHASLPGHSWALQQHARHDERFQTLYETDKAVVHRLDSLVREMGRQDDLLRQVRESRFDEDAGLLLAERVDKLAEESARLAERVRGIERERDSERADKRGKE